MLHVPLRRRAVLGVGAAALAAPAATLAAPASAYPAAPWSGPADPATALARLLAGNRRFAAGRARHPRQSPAYRRELAAGQRPFTVLLGCADSRVPPEILFDQGLGDIFDDRVAGNIVDDLHLGSMEFAVEEFSPALVVVLGHERCGAVAATLSAIATGETPPGHIGAIVEALRPILAPLAGRPDALEAGVRANVRAQVAAIRRRSEIVRHHAEAGSLAVVGARYDLDSGLVTLVR